MALASAKCLLLSLRELALTGDAGGATDGQLLERFLTYRQEAAFRALLDRHGPMVMGVCRRVLHNAHDAEDAFQATFLVLARKAASVVPRECVANWLYGVAYRTAQKARVGRARADALKRRLVARVTAMAEQVRTEHEIWHDLQPVLDQELERLPDKYRAAVVLCDLEGKPRKEAARQLCWPEGTLSGRLARARKLLAERLTRRGVTLSAAALAVVLTKRGVAAAVPAVLKSNVTQAALPAAAGKAVPAGIVSAPVSHLMEGVMKTMLMAKLRLGVLLLTAAGLAATGLGLVAQRVVAGLQQSSQANAAKPTKPDQAKSAEDPAKPADAEMHVISVYGPKDGFPKGGRVDVEVRPTAKPVVLVLTSYYSVDWHVKPADGARIHKVIVSGYFAQEIQGLPAAVPVVNRSYFPDDGSRRKEGWFYAYQWNTLEYRRMVEKLNDLTGLLVATFQAEYTGTSFVVDGKRGRDFAQKERKPRPAPPKEVKPGDLLAAAAGADLHVVSIYQTGTGNGTPVEVEVRPTGKPIVLALASYMSVLWNVKIAEGARVKAVIIGGYFEQESEGVPADLPLVYRTYFPAQRRDFFYAYQSETPEYLGMMAKLNDLTGLLISTAQVAERGTSFIVDGTRGRELVQKERRPPDPAAQQPKPKEDPLADVADIPARELQAAGDADKRYFLIGPKKDAKPPAEGYGLLIILPGGDGSADFHPFVKRIYKNALSDRYVAAQPIAPKWTPDQQIVWPTKTNPVAKMKFSTEELIEAVIEDVAKKHQLDRRRVFTLSWSSSGPAAYAASLQERRGVTGSLIAMSVFNPKFLPPLKGANGHAYYLYHSPQDRVCPYRMAEQARSGLAENGANVRLETYEGGHGWRGNVYGDIRNGVEWLERNQEKASKP